MNIVDLLEKYPEDFICKFTTTKTRDEQGRKQTHYNATAYDTHTQWSWTVQKHKYRTADGEVVREYFCNRELDKELVERLYELVKGVHNEENN